MSKFQFDQLNTVDACIYGEENLLSNHFGSKMASKEIIALVCFIAFVVAEYPEPPKKEKGYEFKVHKQYHSILKKDEKHKDPYESQKDDGYKKEQYGRVSVKKYGYRKEYGNDERNGYGSSDKYPKPSYNDAYEPNEDNRKRSPYEQQKPNKYKSRGYHNNEQDSFKFSNYKPQGYEQEKPHGYHEEQSYGPPKYIPQDGYGNRNDQYGPPKHEPHGYNEKRYLYEPHSKPTHGYKDDRRKNEPYGEASYKPQNGEDKDYRLPERPHGYDASKNYQPVRPRQQYKPREERKHYTGYHRKEYYHNDKKVRLVIVYIVNIKY